MANANTSMILLSFVICLLTSCGQKVQPTIMLDSDRATIGKDGGRYTITFTSNCPWTAEATESWITLSTTRGDASASSVVVTCSPNEGYKDRDGWITFSIDGWDATFHITQKENTGLIIDDNDQYIEVSEYEEAFNVAIEYNIQEYAVSSDVSWIIHKDTKSMSYKRLWFTALQNDTYNTREGTITITDTENNIAHKVIVKQSQNEGVLIKKKELTVSCTAQNIPIEIGANIDYTVKSDSDWLEIASADTKALTSETLIVIVTENKTFSERVGHISVTDQYEKVQTITITQEARSNVIAGYKLVDFGLSVYWADKNYNASSQTDAGTRVIWGDANGTRSNIPNSIFKAEDSIAGNTEYDVVANCVGNGWRMPTKAECQELMRKCNFAIVTVDGIRGMKVSKSDGTYIFLPYASQSTINRRTTSYWTATYCKHEYYSTGYIECVYNFNIWGSPEIEEASYDFCENGKHSYNFYMVRPVMDK